MKSVRVVGICGSLRKGSTNAALLRAVAGVDVAGCEVTLFEAIDSLPHYNPDFDLESAPPAVAAFRAVLEAADGLVISTPEYAHGIPGALKNALDWLVSSGELVDKPVLLVNGATSGGAFAESALIEVLQTMSATVLRDFTVRVPSARKQLAADGTVLDEALRSGLILALGALVAAAAARPGLTK